MAANSTRGGAILPPSLCSKCGIRPRRRAGAYCRECDREWHRESSRRKKSCRRCDGCGQPLPHKGRRGCPTTRIANGRRKISERWPGYGELLTDETLLLRAERDGCKIAGFPLPSRLFAGVEAALDERLKREHRDKDVGLCQALAQIPASDQREFLELYLVDPLDAQRWASLPTWKRPIRKGDKDDQQIWAFFTMQRLNMEQAAREAPPWSMASQGAQLPQMFGALARLSPIGLQKLVAVMNTYGVLLQYGRDLGDVTKKPWEERRVPI